MLPRRIEGKVQLLTEIQFNYWAAEMAKGGKTNVFYHSIAHPDKDYATLQDWCTFSEEEWSEEEFISNFPGVPLQVVKAFDADLQSIKRIHAFDTLHWGSVLFTFITAKDLYVYDLPTWEAVLVYHEGGYVDYIRGVEPKH